MTEEQLDELKTMIQTTPNNPKGNNAVMQFFLDNFSEEPDALDPPASTTRKNLTQVVTDFVTALFGKDAILQLRLSRAPEYSFIWGPFLVEGRVGTVIYFEEENIGLISLIWSHVPPENKFLRFPESE